MKRLGLVLGLLATVLVAKETYMTYRYHDSHRVATRINGKAAQHQQIEIDGILHVRLLEHNQTHTALFWLQNDLNLSAPIQPESIFAPFVVTYDPDGFVLKRLDTLSRDRLIREKIQGIIDALQYRRSRTGVYRLPNALGHLEVNATRTGQHYTLQCLHQYTHSRIRDDIRYFDSRMTIEAGHPPSIWTRVEANETIKFFVSAMKSTLLDRRMLHLDRSKIRLPKGHWFYDLTADITQWNLSSTHKPTLSLQQAQKVFPQKIAELKDLIDRNLSIESWVRNNLDLLSHLSELLQGYDLDDRVSRKLFAELGYIDTAQSVSILSDVVLEGSIKPIERFRSLMGLKNTSASIDESQLSQLISMGLSSGGGEIERTLGLLIGALAYERADRVPAQFQTISDALLSALSEQEDKSIVLGSVGNLHQTAPNAIVQEVGEIVMHSDKSRDRLDGAAALLRFHRSTLPLDSIKDLVQNETNSDTAAMLIRATSVANDRTEKEEEQIRFLLTIAGNQTRMKSNRIAALETLKQAGYGKTPEQKRTIRTMMLHEKDSEVQAILREIFRQR